jgi:hypothetical protein
MYIMRWILKAVDGITTDRKRHTQKMLLFFIYATEINGQGYFFADADVGYLINANLEPLPALPSFYKTPLRRKSPFVGLQDRFIYLQNLVHSVGVSLNPVSL